MVKLQKLVLRNFKSFRKAEIPISKGFTVIVGGNGSGKTNILDALLFVMGTTSLKSLRAARLTELVNTAAVENYAKVELALKHGDRTYEIERMIDKQGKCVYRLDGQRKTLGEISSLMRELGVKPQGHNIVVQGDVTRIVEMSPEERRQIIDEMAGLQEFDEKKEEALKNLDKVDVKMRDATIVMQERENYLAGLQQEKEAAELFGQLGKERKEAKATLLFHEAGKIEKALGEINARLGSIEEEKAEREKQAEQAAEEAGRLREEARSLNEEILGSSEKIYASIGSALEGERAGKSRLEERVERNREMVARNNRRVEEAKQAIAAIEVEIEAEGKRASEIAGILPGLRKELLGVEERKQVLEAKQEKSEEGLREMHEREKALSGEVAGLNEGRMKAVSALNVLRKEKGMMQEQVQQLLQEKKRLKIKVEGKENAGALLRTLQKRFGNIGEELAAAEKKKARLLGEGKSAEAEKKLLRESVAILGKSIAQCPVCESSLKKAKKEELLREKEAGLKAASERIAKIGERMRELLTREKELREAGEKERELQFQLQDLKELQQGLQACREKIAALRQTLEARDEERGSAEIASIEAQLREKQGELNGIVENRRQAAGAAGLAALRELGEKGLELHRKINALQQERNAITGKAVEQLHKRKQGLAAEIESLKAENRGIVAGIEETGKGLQAAEAKISGLEAELHKAEQENKRVAGEKAGVDEKIEKVLERERRHEKERRGLEQQESALQIEKSKHEVRLADLQEEAAQLADVARLESFDEKQLAARIAEIDRKMQEMGAINMKAIESFGQLQEEVQDVRKKVEQLEREKQAVLEMIEKIDVRRKNIFMQCFEALNRNFSEMFFTLFSGQGRLSLSNQDQPLESGLLIEARHKGESIKNIDSMSGGEKTLTALAFLFAIQLYEPAPFYIFDEADAALDKENSQKMVKIIKEISKKSQFIAITHNDPLMQSADQIIGVALNKQKSSVIGLKLREKIAKGEAIAT